ncbi:pyocin knob domain-containing protein, partial [Chromobacterium vaccinii]|uniref:pyocin knob domain-containing protein n=1 Tax=Chromobacterium vaccinii TaxID=1108595 RepID=UPI003C7473F5
MKALPIPSSPGWPSITQYEVTERLLGGPDGPLNRAPAELLERTEFLKRRIDDIVSGALVAEYAGRLKASRSIAMTGDGSWSVSFDGGGNASGAMTLANSGVGPGRYSMVTVDAKGRVISGQLLAGDDVPAHDWGKITTGKPTTLAGYGIADGASKAELQTAINNLVAGAPGALDTLKELSQALNNDASFATTVTNALAKKADKAATLAGYGIADALPLRPPLDATDLNAIIADGLYHQPANLNAANGKNWPVPQAGLLFVRADGEMVYQQYQAFADGGFWYRCRYQSAWSAWRQLVDAGAARPAGQLVTMFTDSPPPG